jgi:hypothetical protein
LFLAGKNTGTYILSLVLVQARVNKPIVSEGIHSVKKIPIFTEVGTECVENAEERGTGIDINMKKTLSSTKPNGRPPSVINISARKMRVIRRISEQARVPFQQVSDDVIDNGLLTVLPMYENMIEFRRTRETRLKTLFKKDEPIPSESTGQRIAEEQPELAPIEHEPTAGSAGFTNGDAAPIDADSYDRSNDASFGTGFEHALDTDSEGVNADSE